MSLSRIEPLQPLTRQPGMWAVLPQTHCCACVYPTQIQLLGPSGEQAILPLETSGLVHSWQAQLDLLEGSLAIWGEGGAKFHVTLRRVGQSIVALQKGKDPIELLPVALPTPPPPEHLQFGCHDKVLIEAIGPKLSLARSLQGWFQLGSALPHEIVDPTEASLLGRLALAIEEEHPFVAEGLLQDLWKVGFSGLWVPQATDASLWGSALPPTLTSPWHLLSAGARLIRSLFVQSEATRLHLLPLRPPSLLHGRFLEGRGPHYRFAFEWTRGAPRRCTLHATHTTPFCLHWPKGRSVRLQCLDAVRQPPRYLQAGEMFELREGNSYLLDRFS